MQENRILDEIKKHQGYIGFLIIASLILILSMLVNNNAIYLDSQGYKDSQIQQHVSDAVDLCKKLSVKEINYCMEFYPGTPSCVAFENINCTQYIAGR